MTEKAQIRATVIGGLILAAVLWFVGILKPIFAAVGRVALAALHAMTASVTLPVWLLVLLSVGVAAAVLRTRSNRLRIPPGSAQPVTLATPPPPPPLDEHEMAVFKRLVDADGGLVSSDQLMDDLQIRHLLVDKALEGLWNRGYLGDNYSRRMGRRFHLSPRGRDAAIQQGLVK